jgi:pimeloyl-ACP methyl ester carboxylesterase
MVWGSSLLAAVPTFYLASTRTFSSTSTTSSIQHSSSSPTDLVSTVQQLYRDLERPSAIHYTSTTAPTIRFDYVTPPTSDGKATWNDRTIQALMMDELPPELRPQSTKPTALYLPGLDGYGISGLSQFDDLSSSFNLWRMFVLQEDRSSFATVLQSIVDFVRHNITDAAAAAADTTNITLIGESCGGVFAAAAAVELQDQLQGLVLVNPATSFDQTQWATLVPLLAQLPNADAIPALRGQLTPYAMVGSAVLSAIVPDNRQLMRIAQTMITATLPTTPQSLANPIQQPLSLLQATLQSVQGIEERLSAGLLTHRVLQWLDANVATVNADLARHHRAPTLVVIGREDRLLPSRAELKRLQETLAPGIVEALVVPERGHFVLDDSVNLTEAILYSKINPRGGRRGSTIVTKKFDPITDWRIPDDVDRYIAQNVQPLRDLFSPVFFSTDDVTGQRSKGLGKVPSRKRTNGGPLLFVSNHQFLGLDLGIIVAELYEQRGIVPRGLAHPVAFQARQQSLNYIDLGGRVPGLVDDEQISNLFQSGFDKYGAVKVSPRNYYRLLQTGQDALLFPGGAAEALLGNTSYPLAWPVDKVDFVRTAARFNATIVPLSAVGIVDSFQVLAEPKDLLNLPIIGDRLKQLNANTTAARYDRKNEDEFLAAPICAAKTPARNYFIFGKPIYTKDIDPNDKDACELAYRTAQLEVERGISDLLTARSKDPYGDTIRRLTYERLWSKAAPSFDLDELNS